MINIKSFTALLIFFAFLMGILAYNAETYREYAFLALGYFIASIQILIQIKVDQALKRKNKYRWKL